MWLFLNSPGHLLVRELETLVLWIAHLLGLLQTFGRKGAQHAERLMLSSLAQVLGRSCRPPKSQAEAATQ